MYQKFTTLFCTIMMIVLCSFQGYRMFHCGSKFIFMYLQQQQNYYADFVGEMFHTASQCNFSCDEKDVPRREQPRRDDFSRVHLSDREHNLYKPPKPAINTL